MPTKSKPDHLAVELALREKLFGAQTSADFKRTLSVEPIGSEANAGAFWILYGDSTARCWGLR